MKKELITPGGAGCIASYTSITEPRTWTKSCSQNLYMSSHILSPHLNCLSCASLVLTEGPSWPFGTPTLGKPRLIPSTVTKGSSAFSGLPDFIALSWRVIALMFPQRERPTTVVTQEFSRAVKKGTVGGSFFGWWNCLTERKEKRNGMDHTEELFTFKKKKKNK